MNESARPGTDADLGTPKVLDVRLEVSGDSLAYWRSVRERRAAEVALALRMPSGRYLVHTKAFYPQGVYRLLTGGVRPGEDAVAAAHREAREETGLAVTLARYLARVHYVFGHDGQAVPFCTHLYLALAEGGCPRSEDDGEEISGFRELTLEQVAALADALERLPPGWADWGRFRAIVHRLLPEVLADVDG